MDDWEPAVFVLVFLFFGAFIFVFENSAGRDILIAAAIGRMFGCKASLCLFLSWCKLAPSRISGAMLHAAWDTSPETPARDRTGVL